MDAFTVIGDSKVVTGKAMTWQLKDALGGGEGGGSGRGVFGA